MTMFQTDWKKYTEQGTRYRMRVKYGLDYKFGSANNQAPYFSLTGEIEHQAGNNHWYDDSFGQLHTEVVRHFPELARLIKWHLFALGVGPMHYLANAKHWWEYAVGKKELGQYDRHINPKSAFEHTIVYGALPGEGSLSIHPDVPWSEVESWLIDRLDKLLAEFEADMAAIGALEDEHTRNDRYSTTGEPRPKFKIGDRVKRDDSNERGVVSFIAGYDETIGGYRYKVQQDKGGRIHWNETSMRKVR